MSMPRSRALASIAAAALLPAAPPALHATCGSASCFLVTGTREGIAAPGALAIDLSYSYVDQSRKRSGSGPTAEVLTPKVNFEEGVLEPGHHREIGTQNTALRLDLAYGLTGRLSLVGSLPLVNDKEHEHFDDVGSEEEHFTRSDGTRGFGDVQAGVRYGLVVRSRDLLIGGLALKLPTGAHKLHDSEGAINEPTIQPGTGSTDAIASLHYTHEAGRTEWFLSGSLRANTRNDLEYRLGDETVVNAGLSFTRSPRWTYSFQFNARHTARDRFLDDTVPSTGANYLNFTPGVRFRAPSGLSLYGHVQAPLFQRVNEAQLAPGIGLILGVTQRF